MLGFFVGVIGEPTGIIIIGALVMFAGALYDKNTMSNFEWPAQYIGFGAWYVFLGALLALTDAVFGTLKIGDLLVAVIGGFHWLA